MKILRLFIPLLCLASPGVFAAETGDNYFGGQFALVTYDEEGVDEAEPTAGVLRFGRYLNPNVSVEGRFGIGLQDDSVEVIGIDVDVEVKTLMGFYGVFESGGDTGSVYGVIGFTRGELEASALGITVDEDDSGLSFGFGVNIGGFNIEYMSYLDEDEYDATAVSLGFRSTF